MLPYHHSNSPHGVVAYEAGDDYIILKFQSGPLLYKYSYASCGAEHVKEMKRLAKKGKGLSTYINQQKPDYEWKRPDRSS